MALQKINRTKVREMYRRGAFKDIGTVKLASGETVSDAKFREYLEEKAARHGTIPSLMEAVKKDTAKSQWRQRARLGQAFTEPAASKQSLTQQKEQKLQQRQSIFSSIREGVFGGGREAKKPPVLRHLRASSGWGYNPKTGKVETGDTINQRPGMVGSNPKNASIGLGSRLEQAKGAQTGVDDTASRRAAGIGEQSGGSGFKTIGSATNKK